MSDECHLCLLGLIILSSLLTGSSGVDDVHVFISSGEDVRLPCNNALHDCRSTTWIYNRFITSATVELIGLGIKKNNTESHERLSLGSDCSLNIKNITKEDYGFYNCQQYVNNTLKRPDARVYLHVLYVSSSSSQTEISAGSSVSLSCQLYSYIRVSCGDWIRSEGIDLSWVNQAGVDLMIPISRYHILFSSGHCIRTLNITLLNEDDNRELRCKVTHKNKLKTSVIYTVKSSAEADTVIPVLNPKSTMKTPLTSSQGIGIGIVFAALFAVLFPALILWAICKKRASVRRATDYSVEQTDDVTYTEVTVTGKKTAKKNKVRCDDKVTYSAIRGAKAGAQEDLSQLYASVNKSHRKPDK